MCASKQTVTQTFVSTNVPITKMINYIHISLKKELICIPKNNNNCENQWIAFPPLMIAHML